MLTKMVAAPSVYDVCPSELSDGVHVSEHRR
jgi:hypothetical protein